MSLKAIETVVEADAAGDALLHVPVKMLPGQHKVVLLIDSEDEAKVWTSTSGQHSDAPDLSAMNGANGRESVLDFEGFELVGWPKERRLTRQDLYDDD